MSTGYKISPNSTELYFITFQIVGWLDIFTRKNYKEVVAESMKYCQLHKGLNLYAYVIMSNHIHLLANSENGDLSGFIRDFKRFTSQKFFEIMDSDIESRRDWMKMVVEYHGRYKINQTRQIWTHENHAELIYGQNFLEQKLAYIHENPVRAGIVAKPEDYLYSSARNYADMEGPIDIIKLDIRWKTY